MLNANHMRDPAIWQTDLDTLMARVSDHYLVDENSYVSELIEVLNANHEDFACRYHRRTVTAVQPGYP